MTESTYDLFLCGIKVFQLIDKKLLHDCNALIGASWFVWVNEEPDTCIPALAAQRIAFAAGMTALASDLGCAFDGFAMGAAKLLIPGRNAATSRIATLFLIRHGVLLEVHQWDAGMTKIVAFTPENLPDISTSGPQLE